MDGNAIFNDILAFLWFKMKICPRDSLLSIVKSYYSVKDIVTARDILYDNVPEIDNKRRVKHRNIDDDLISMYNVLQEIPTESDIFFTVRNLNNIPCVDLKNVDAASLICKQNTLTEVISELKLSLSNQIADILKEQSRAKFQLDSLCDKVDTNSLRPPTNLINNSLTGICVKDRVRALSSNDAGVVTLHVETTSKVSKLDSNLSENNSNRLSSSSLNSNKYTTKNNLRR